MLLLKSFSLFLFLPVILLCLNGCRQGHETPPVPEAKMGQILLDMQLAESYSQGLGINPKNHFEKNEDSLTGFYASVLKHYGMDFKEFNEALEWYKERPLQLDSLYGKVLNRLIELKAKENIRDIDPPSETDSLLRAKTGTTQDSVRFKADALRSRILQEDTTLKKNKADSGRYQKK